MPAQPYAQPFSAADRGEIDMVALVREVARRKWLVLGATLGALVLSTVAVNVLKPRYTAETRVFLENRDTEYTRIGRESGRASDTPIDQDAVLSQVQIIQSRDIARAMIRRFDLGSRAEFDDLRDGVDAVTKIGVLLGILNNPASMSPEERVLEKYFDKLKAFAVAKSRVVAIEFQSRDPELAAKLSDAIAEEYIRQLELAKQGSAKAAGSWLGRTIESLRERVATAEAKVEAYRSQNGLFMVGAPSEGGGLSAQQLSELNTQLATARATQAELSGKARIVREAIRQGRIFEVSEVVNNESVRRLIENRATLKAQIAQEERTLLPQHPRIKELRGQLVGLEEQVRAAAERAARAFENDARAAGARVAASQAELDQQKRLSGTANEQEVQLRALEREAKAEREQLETYLARWRDALSRDADNAVAADARIVSRAIVPSNPSFPKRIPIIIVATLAGLAVSLFWVLTKALLSDTIYARRPQTSPQPYSPAPVAEVWAAALPTYAVRLQAAAPMAPAFQPSAASPALTPAADPLRRALDRVAETLDKGLRRSGEEAFQPARPISAEATAPEAPSLAPAMADMASAREDAGPAGPSFDPFNPLVEVAEEAEAARIGGRPASILIFSTEGEAAADRTAAALRRILESRGATAISGPLEEDATEQDLAAAVRAHASYDFVLLEAGAPPAGAAALSRAATLTVLVASDDVADTRADEASRLLVGCSYFIVGASAAAEIAPA
jgi:uncharacterized protein involved in exopolysaccharide biosynthesis